MSPNIFRLNKPCSNCPFRSDKPFYLDSNRVDEIADSLESGEIFHCHKTVDYSLDDGDVSPKTQFCAGARATLENQELFTLPFAFGRFLGYYNKRLPSNLPVYGSLGEWRKAMKRNNG